LNRKEFLEKHWERYPVKPPEALAWGVIESIQKKSQTWAFRIGTREAEIQTQSQEKQDFQFAEVGDLAAIDTNKQFILLAPQLSKSPVKNLMTLQTQKKWNLFLNELRQFFQRQNFIELQTPLLVTCPGPEPTLEVFKTEFEWGSLRRDYFLPTSPELAIKKFLAHAVREEPQLKIFEITRSFRNGEVTERHQPEFHILEWYRSFENLQSLQQDILNLVQMVNPGSSTKIEKKSMSQLFQERLSFTLTPETTAEEMKNLALRLGLDPRGLESFDDLFHLVFIEKIEYSWSSEVLFFLEKYPPSQAALARIDSEGWGERFEFYWKGYEIANAFHELNDPEIQRQRFKEDLKMKKRYGRKEIPEDLDFFKALDHGLPPTSGVALGIERLFMAVHGIDQIGSFRWFPIEP